MSRLTEIAVRRAAVAALLSNEEIETRLALATALIDEREYDAALEHIAVLQRARPGWFPFRLQQARALLYGRADSQGALSAAEACLALAPTQSACLELAGAALIDLGRRDDAIERLEACIALDPGRSSAAELLARLLTQAQRWDDAVAVTTETMRLRGRTVGLLLLRATAHERRGDLESAEVDFVAIASMHVDRASGVAYLTGFLRRQDRDAEADRIERTTRR